MQRVASKHIQEALKLICISDEVLWLSMQTLIHRAAPRAPGSSTSFTDECINSARAALGCHQSYMSLIESAGPLHLSSYMNWLV